jgi:hypothetical protein
MNNGKEKIVGSRQFLVFTQPHNRDPELNTPVIEIDGSTEPPTEIPYDNLDVIESVILSLGRQMARAKGYNAGAQAVLDAYGLTIKDYVAKRKENKREKALDKGGEVEVSSNNEVNPS